MPLVFNPRTGLFEEKRYTHPPSIISFNLADGNDSVFSGFEYRLKWEAQEFDRICIDNVDCTNRSEYKLTAVGNGKVTHILTAYNECGESSLALNLTIINHPTIEFTATRNKLKLGFDETTKLRWKVVNSKRVEICYNDITRPVDDQGEIIVSPTETTIYTIHATALDGRTIIESSQKIELHKPSSVVFDIDKKFTIPGIPVIVSWKVKNAKRVELLGKGEVKLSASEVIELEKETTLKLIVEDNFGVTEYEKVVHMLPMPQIKALLVPTPMLEQQIKLHISQPRLNLNLRFPIFSFLPQNINIPKLNLPMHVSLNNELLPTSINNILRITKRILKLFSFKWIK